MMLYQLLDKIEDLDEESILEFANSRCAPLVRPLDIITSELYASE